MAVDWITVVVSAAINTPAVAGLLGWLGKRRLEHESAQHNSELETLKASYVTELEKYKDQLDRSKLLLQADIDKTILVTRVHFETEFDALKSVFARLAEVKLQMPAVRPKFSVALVDETLEKKLARLTDRINALQEAYNGLLETSEHLSAFYPQNIHEQVEQCLRRAKCEISDSSHSREEIFTQDWYDRGQSNVEEFMKIFESVSTLIRDRISKLAIARAA
jgi:hypothetical protein